MDYRWNEVKQMQITKSVAIMAGMGVGLLMAGPSDAAVLQATYTPIPAVNGSGNYSGFVNFADEGTLDWAVWEKTGNGSASGTPTASKDGAAFIGDAFAINGNGKLRGGGGTDLEISLTPGQTAGQGRATAGAILNQSLQGVDAGVGVTITVPTTDTYVARIYVGGFRTNNNLLQAILPGADPVTFDPQFGDTQNGFKDAGLLEVTFKPDAVDGVANVLRVEITLNPTADNSSHVLLQGVTLIPEPASVGVLGLTGVALCRRRRM